METLPVVTDEPVKAPLPAWSYRILNPTLKFLLCSPLQRAMSGGIMLLYFTGRKTGKRYEIVLACQSSVSSRCCCLPMPVTSENARGCTPKKGVTTIMSS